MGNIWLQGKLGLLPEGADQSGATLAAPKLPPRFPAQMWNILGTEVRQGMSFQMAPDVFGGIEFRRVSRQLRQNDLTVGTLHVITHFSAAVHGQAVPDDQQSPANLAAQVTQKLHRLPALDGAAKETKVKLPPSDAGDHREFAPRMAENQLGCFSLARPSAHDARTFRQSALVHKDQRAAFLQGLFLSAGQVWRRG